MSAIYNIIGQKYDYTRKPDPIIVQRMLELLQPIRNGNYLDLGCGTGNYTGELYKAGLKIDGIDVSDIMLNNARKKYPHIMFHLEDARNLHFKNSSIDGVTCVLAMHHIVNNLKAFEEVFRVLKTGKFVIFTSTPEQMRKYWLCHYFPKMMHSSIAQMEPCEQVSNKLKSAGFSRIEITPFFVTDKVVDLFLYSGKLNPEIYLDENVRKGISSFQFAKDQDEIYSGLRSLKQDIINGNIGKIADQYKNDLGDYIFITATKN